MTENLLEGLFIPITRENPTKPNKKKKKRLAPRKKLMIQALSEELGIVTSACRKVGINSWTHYDWLKSDKDYKDAVEALETRKEDVIEKAFLSLVIDKNPQAVIHAVKTKLKKRGYGDEIKVEGNLNQPAIFNEVTKTREEIKNERNISKQEAAINAQSTG